MTSQLQSDFLGLEDVLAEISRLENELKRLKKAPTESKMPIEMALCEAHAMKILIKKNSPRKRG